MKPYRPTLWIAAALVLTLAACSKPTPPPEVAPAAAMPAPAVAAVESSDIDVTTLVKTALLSDNDTKAFEVAVVTTKGDVRLTGVMDTQMQIDRALTITRAITGVHAVHDELTLKK
jgi:hyperosmotically inducible periplasmic protein